jgi:hypothetical protein
MALTIGQIQAVSYNEVLSNSRKAENQWGEAAWLRELERQGAVIRKDFGASSKRRSITSAIRARSSSRPTCSR